MQKISVFTDGGARGNPGPAAVGVVIKDEKGEIINQFGKTIGETTNNVAEYMAVIEALRWIQEKFSIPNSQFPMSFYLDSKLVVNQLSGVFKIKDSRLHGLMMLVRELEAKINLPVFYTHIPREKNWQADKLVNEALDLAGNGRASHVP